MKILELFAGSRSIGKEADKLGYTTFSTDLTGYDKIDYQVDILEFDYKRVPFIPDMIWASPPCTTFSIAACGYHRKPGQFTEEAILGDKIVLKTLEIIEYYKKLNPNIIWYIENPQGLLKKQSFMQNIGIMNTVWYCKYGFNIAKPTNIWTNNDNFIGKKCHNKKKDKDGNVIHHCHHESAPRGSRTGTQGKANAHERSKIPPELCLEIIKATGKKNI